MQVREIRVTYGKGAKMDARKCLTPKCAAEIIRAFIGPGEPREHFITLLLDSRHRALALDRITIGTLNTTLVHPREVFRAAIVAGAQAIIVAHNHPSGDVQPSTEDYTITRRLIEVGKLVGIEVLDSLVVSDDAHHSMQEGGDVAFS